MARLIRTAPEKRNLRRIAIVYAILANMMITQDMFDEAGIVLPMAGVAATALMQPSRSWQKGINRVAIWSFDNMFSEEKAYECAATNRCGRRPCLSRCLVSCTGTFVSARFPQGRHA